MQKRKMFSFLLVGVTVIGLTVITHLLGNQENLFDFNAAPKTFVHTFGAEQGPGEEGEKIGMIEDKNKTFYYSTNSSLTSESFLVLSATDAKTPGVLMNLTVINGLSSIRANFSGGPLYAIATQTIFEDFVPDVDDTLTNNLQKSFGGHNNGYLLLMTDSTSPVTIDQIQLGYTCDHETDEFFGVDPNVNHVVGARSLAKDIYIEHDAIRFETNPTANTNNYSSGQTDGRNNYWYRFNGVSPRNYALVDGVKDYTLTPKGTFTSNNFEVIISVMVDPNVFYNPNAYYCVAPWVALATADHEGFPNGSGTRNIWMQSYIGNDNFDPIGGLNLLERTDTYEGRFFTNYVYNGTEYGFQDPDATTIVGGSMTLREAYGTINLPFFNVRFVVEGNSYTVFINGLEVCFHDEAFYDSSDYVGQSFCIEEFTLQGVNYGDGIDSDGEGEDTIATPLPGYGLAFGNPIVREID